MEAQKEAIEPRRCDSMMTDKARQNAAKYSVDPPREKKKRAKKFQPLDTSHTGSRTQNNTQIISTSESLGSYELV